MTRAPASDRDVDFDVARLDEYLKGWFGGDERVRVERTQGGMSNPTYFVTRGDWRAVLRKQPSASADALRACDRPRVPRADRAAGQRRSRRPSRIATATTAK